MGIRSMRGLGSLGAVVIALGSSASADASCPGDLNGDGIPDVIMGAPGYSTSTLTYAGAAIVLFGGDALSCPIVIGDMTSTDGILAVGEGSFHRFGESVDIVGDANADTRVDHFKPKFKLVRNARTF